MTKEPPEPNSIVSADAYTHLEGLESNSVDHVITSPPYYDKRDYDVNGQMGQEDSVNEYIERLLEVFEECLRVTKNDGNIVFNVGDKRSDRSKLLIPYRFATRVIEEYESVNLVNDITWLKSNPTPKKGDHYLTESTEPFLHFAQSDEYFHNPDNFMTHLDESNIKDKARSRTQDYGKGYYDKIEQGDLTPEEKEEAKRALEEAREKVQNGEITGFRMKIRGVHALPYGGRGGRMTHLENKGYSVIELTGSVMKKDVIESSVENSLDWNDEHPAIYPEYIIKELLALLTEEENLVLDPFIGSGTTAAVCATMNRDYHGIDLNEEYCERAEQRVEDALLGTLPNDVDLDDISDLEKEILVEMLKNPEATQTEIGKKVGKSGSYISKMVLDIDGIEWGSQQYLLNGHRLGQEDTSTEGDKASTSLDSFEQKKEQ